MSMRIARAVALALALSASAGAATGSHPSAASPHPAVRSADAAASPAPAAPASAPATQPAASAAPASTSIDALDWMAGAWGATGPGGTQMEEHWLSPKGGLMLGVHREVMPNGKAFFEFLRIEVRPEGIVYLAQPGGQPPTPFRMTALEERRVVFENPEHDFPSKITYWIDAGGALRARVEGTENGKPASMEWTWPRMP